MANEEETNKQLVLDCYDAFNRRDYRKVKDLISEDVEYRWVPFDQNFQGKDEVVKSFEDMTQSFPDLKLQVKNLIVTEDGGVAELLGEGTHQGTLSTPEGDIPATGKKVSFEECEVITIKDGKITSVHSYFDTGTTMRQLGIRALPSAA